jgi:hypothetical protein
MCDRVAPAAYYTGAVGCADVLEFGAPSCTGFDLGSVSMVRTSPLGQGEMLVTAIVNVPSQGSTLVARS